MATREEVERAVDDMYRGRPDLAGLAKSLLAEEAKQDPNIYSLFDVRESQGAHMLYYSNSETRIMRFDPRALAQDRLVAIETLGREPTQTPPPVITTIAYSGDNSVGHGGVPNAKTQGAALVNV